MPWEGHQRRDRLPPDWKQRRAAILDRDGWQCRQLLRDGSRCPARATDVDHIIRGDNHDPANLQSMCGPHHRTKTALEANAAKPKRKRPPEPHPGLP